MAEDHEKVKYIIDKNINALRSSQHNLMNQHNKIGQYVIGIYRISYRINNWLGRFFDCM